MSSHSLNYPLCFDDDEGLILDIKKPYSYGSSDRSISIKQKLLQLIGFWFKVPADKIKLIDELLYIFTNSSQIYDDVVDYTRLRRGKPTSHFVYGVPRSLIAIDWKNYFDGFDLAEKFDDVEANRLLLQMLITCLAGTGLELYAREKNDCLTIQEYFNMAYLKTGTLCMSAARVFQRLGTAKAKNYDKFLSYLGIYLQIYEDYRNLRDPIYFEEKGFCEDITEGKFSFPFVHAINNFPEEGLILKEILSKRTCDVEEKNRCIAILERCGSFEYTRRVLKSIKEIMFEEFKKVDDNPLITHFLETSILNY